MSDFISDDVFAHFGCWNKEYCPSTKDSIKEKNDLRKVIDTLNKDTDIETLFVAGDNYYEPEYLPSTESTPEKVEKDKKKEKEDKLNKTLNFMYGFFRSGFACLEDVKHLRNIHVGMGNHEVHYSDKDCNVMESIKELKNEDACIVKGKNPKLKFHFCHFENLKYCDVLMIDTTIYEEVKGEKPTQYHCYKHILDEDKDKDVLDKLVLDKLDLEEQRKSLKAYQLGKINGYLSENLHRRLIVIGHHPMVGIKSKEKKKKEDNNKEKKYENKAQRSDELIGVFRDNILPKRPNVTYLCADVHLYQKGVVTIDMNDNNNNNNKYKIHQYIVGTGGTTLDEPPLDDQKKTTNYTHDESIRNHGYLKVQVNPKGKVEAKFVEVDPPTQSGGRRTRRKRSRKRKSTRKRRRRSRRRKS